MPMKISRFDGSNTWHGRAWHGCHVAGSSYAADDAEISVIHSGSDVFGVARNALSTKCTTNHLFCASSTTNTPNQIQEKHLRRLRQEDQPDVYRNRKSSSIERMYSSASFTFCFIFFLFDIIYRKLTFINNLNKPKSR